MNINAKATFNVTQTVLPHIVDGGSIVSLSSLAGLSAFADHTVYACSKAAVDALSRGEHFVFNFFLFKKQPKFIFSL